MMAVRIVEKSVTVYLAPASLPEVWKTFLATTEGLTQLRISGFGRRQKLWLSNSTYPLLPKYFHPLFCRAFNPSRAPKKATRKVLLCVKDFYARKVSLFSKDA